LFGKTEKERSRCRSRSARASSTRPSVFQPRTSLSRLAAEQALAYSSSSASFSGVAARVSARTLLKEIRPRAIASEISGSDSSARAARTFSPAVSRVIPIRHASHSAQEPKPSSAQSR
jgi:hypothetical protein